MSDSQSPNSDWRTDWEFPAGVSYLNHGSFGPSPRPVREALSRWNDALESQPMDFFVRQMEPELDVATVRLGNFVGADPRDVLLLDNATWAMNIVAHSVELAEGDEVLLTDHEYGAVRRVWQAVCNRVGARVVTARLPDPVDSVDAVVDAVFASVTPRTRMLVVSHVTSPTALILPVAEICARARSSGVPVCIDGPHAVAMLPLKLSELGCDYYAASCHKWLSAPFGSGFLYVRRGMQSRMRSVVTSWGRSVGGRGPDWRDEFNWLGTRNPAPLLSIPAAIDYLEGVGLDVFREHSFDLARYARTCLSAVPGVDPFVESVEWQGSMATLVVDAPAWPKPSVNETDELQQALWSEHQIEVPLTRHGGQRLLRVSCHMYNTRAEIDGLCEALKRLLGGR